MMLKYILFTQPEHENIDFSFTPNKVEQFIQLWNEGHSVPEIASKMYRKQIEVTMLAMDLHMTGRIKEREGGFFGSLKEAS